MNSSVFELITDKLANERLDSIVLQDPEYGETIDEADQRAEDLKKFNFNREIREAIFQLISVYLTQNEIYAKIAYQQGFMDSIELLMEIGLIKQIK